MINKKITIRPEEHKDYKSIIALIFLYNSYRQMITHNITL